MNVMVEPDRTRIGKLSPRAEFGMIRIKIGDVRSKPALCVILELQILMARSAVAVIDPG